MTGVIVINKPMGWTSHDVVAKCRGILKIKKVGHLGTLDPAATGVLPLVVGRATRLAQFYNNSEKEYDGVVHFGWTTDSYDLEGEITSERNEPDLDCARLEELLARFRGPIEQMPPPVSAKKIGGVPAYKLARKKKPVDLKPVEVTIHSLEMLRCQGAEARLKVHCSSGTYLRSMAHDLGKAYGCGAFLQSLVRTRSAEFTLDAAWTIEQLQELAEENRLREALIPAARMMPEIPEQTVDNLTAAQIRQGRDFRGSPFRTGQPARRVKAVSEAGDLVAIGEATLPNTYHPVIVL